MARPLLFWVFVWAAGGLAATPTNVSIDDLTGDEKTGLVITYEPPGDLEWGEGQLCPKIYCTMSYYVNPDMAYKGSWHDAHPPSSSQPMNFTLTFNGIAVWVFAILANSPLTNVTSTGTSVRFVLDNQPAGSFVHNPDSSSTNHSLTYNASIFSHTTLEDGPHNLTVLLDGGSGPTVLLFDYALYTTLDSDTEISGSAPTSSGTATSSSSPSTTSSLSGTSGESGRTSVSLSSTTIGGIAAGVGVLALVAALLGFYLIRRRKRRANLSPNLASHNAWTDTGFTTSVTVPFSPDPTTQSLGTRTQTGSQPRSGTRTSTTVREELEALKREMRDIRLEQAVRRLRENPPAYQLERDDRSHFSD